MDEKHINVNRLYIASLYRKISEEDVYKNGKTYVNSCGKFVKDVVVYHECLNTYIDIKSNERYNMENVSHVFMGELYLRPDADLIPLNEILDIDFKKEEMSRKKILKKLSNTSLYNKKEEDK